jgi:hypothetical protein
MQWCRLYNETASDPKFRYIAAHAGVTPAVVLGVWTAMLCHASGQKDDKRGTLFGFDCRIAAFDLGIEPAVLLRVKNAMEGFLLDGEQIIAWAKRQFDTDSSRARTKAWRERQRDVTSQDAAVTSPDADVTSTRRVVTACDVPEERRVENKKEPPLRGAGTRAASGSRLPADWQPSGADLAFASGLGLDGARIAASFRDYWAGVPGARGRKADWPATWRTWCRKEAERPRQPAQRASKMDWLIADYMGGKQ